MESSTFATLGFSNNFGMVFGKNQLVIDKSVYFVENSSIFCPSFGFSRTLSILILLVEKGVKTTTSSIKGPRLSGSAFKVQG